MNANIIAAASFLFALSSFPAAAVQDVDCEEAQTQAEITYCAGEDFKTADKELNKVYGEAMAAMKQIDANLDDIAKGAADSLKAAQRLWISYRDKACDTYGYLARGGSMEPMLILNCRTDLTINRTEELDALADGLGN